MEIARMNYYFTGILIILLTLLAFCVTPAYPRNEYLNNNDRCGEFEARIEQYQNDTNYNSSGSTDYNNENFALLVSKCRGVVPQADEIESMPTGSLWDELKEDYIKENPESKTLDNNNSTLKVPPEGYILPLPKPIDE